MKSECTQTTRNKKIVFQENKSKLTIVNKDEVLCDKITVDGCEITEGKRCDFLLLIKQSECYVELKGQDVNKAIEQIETTIKKLSVNSQKHKKRSYIIGTRIPLSSETIQNLKIQFRKKYNSTLIVKSTPYEDTI